MISPAGLNGSAGVKGRVLSSHATLRRARSSCLSTLTPRSRPYASATAWCGALPRSSKRKLKLVAPVPAPKGIPIGQPAIHRTLGPRAGSLRAPSGFSEDDSEPLLDALSVYTPFNKVTSGDNNILPGAPADVAAVDVPVDVPGALPQDRRPTYLIEITNKAPHTLVPADGMTWDEIVRATPSHGSRASLFSNVTGIMDHDEHNAALVLCYNRWKYELYRHANGSPAIPRPDARILAIQRGLVDSDHTGKRARARVITTAVDLPVHRNPYAPEILGKPSDALVPADGMTWPEILKHGRLLKLFSNMKDDLRSDMAEWEAAQLLCHNRFHYEGFRYMNGFPAVPHTAARCLAFDRGFVSSPTPPTECPVTAVDGFPTNDHRLERTSTASSATDVAGGPTEDVAAGPTEDDPNITNTTNTTNTMVPSNMDDGHRVTVIDEHLRVMTPIPMPSDVGDPSLADGNVETTTDVTADTNSNTNANTNSNSNAAEQAGNASIFSHRRPTNVSRRVDVGPMNKMAARRPPSKFRHPVQLDQLFPNKEEHAQYLEVLDRLERAKEDLNRELEGPKADLDELLDAFVRETEAKAEKIRRMIRSVLEAIVLQVVRVAVAYVGMCILWHIPNIGVELSVAFILWWWSYAKK